MTIWFHINYMQMGPLSVSYHFPAGEFLVPFTTCFTVHAHTIDANINALNVHQSTYQGPLNLRGNIMDDGR